MELKDLVGEHILDAVDYSNAQVKMRGEKFEMCQVMRFRLDGKVYTVTEDPDDGNRSSMREITVGDWPMSNAFPGRRVVGVYLKNKSYVYDSDILELIVKDTGETVITVGTDYNDDCYPSFVANFRPEAMALNTTPVFHSA